MNPIVSFILQNLLKYAGGLLAAHHVLTSADSSTAITDFQTILGAVLSLAGLAWHFKSAASAPAPASSDSPPAPPRAPLGKQSLNVPVLAPLLAGLLFAGAVLGSGCVSSGRGGVAVGFMPGDAIGVRVVGTNSTNSYLIKLPVNLTNIVSGLISTSLSP